MAKVSEEHLQARRRQILNAASACFARKGFQQTTMSDIAREAGLSTGLAYRYFSSKDEIIEATVRGHESPALAHLVEEQAVGQLDDFGRLIEMVTKYEFAQYEHRPGGVEANLRVRVRSWVEALQNPEVEKEVLARWHQRIDTAEEWVRTAQEQGQINNALQARAVARVMLAVHDGFSLQWLIDRDVDRWSFREAMMALFSGSFRSGGKEPDSA